MNAHSGNGRRAKAPYPLAETRWLEIKPSALGLPADTPTLDDLATAAAHVYERFVPYADEGWQWVTYPGSRDFEGWVYSTHPGRRMLAGARVLSRRVAGDAPASDFRSSHGLSAYRTRQ